MSWKQTLAVLLFGWALPAQTPDAERALDAARRLKSANSLEAAVKAYDAGLPAMHRSGDRRAIAGALLEAGQTALAAGAYDRASSWGMEAAGLFRAMQDAANESQACNVAGLSQLYRGDYPAALQTFERALQADRAQKDARGEISRLSNIGSVYFFQGKYVDALDTYDQAMRRVNETAGAAWNPGRRQLILANFAILYEQLGQNQKALDYYQQAAGGSSLTPAEQGQLLSSIGTLYRRLGDAVKALESYRKAESIFSREHMAGAEIHILQNVGIAQALDFHDYPKAVAAFGQALELGESTSNRREIVLAHLFRGEAYYRMQNWERARADFAAAASDASAIGAREEEWTALYGRGRLERQAGQSSKAQATFQASIGIIESLRADLGKPSLRTEFLGDKRQVYDAAIDLLLRSERCDQRELFSLVEHARARNLQDRLRTGSVALTLDTVQSKLPGGTVLLEYWTGEGQIAAQWITRNATGVITRAVTAPFQELLDRASDQFAKASWREPAVRLGELLLAGIPWPDPLSHVIVVPDGVLSTVPLEALIEARGRPTLVERAAVSYLPSAAILLRPTNSRATMLPWRPQLIAFGDPIADSSGVMTEDARWVRLPESDREMRSIARTLPGRAAIYAGARNLKRHFLEADLAAASMLHFSTHAAVDAADPNLSRILFTPEPGKRGSEYLFRSELESLPLDGVDLVTLSACDTERGRILRSEGVQSFSRAFLASGARSTVTTLWRVADKPAADFMSLFYQRLSKGDSKAQALRSAKMRFLASGTDLSLPVYWAAFVLNGDGNSPVRGVISWSEVGVCGALLGAVIFLLAQARARRSRAKERV